MGNESIALVTDRVKRVHIGLHAYHAWFDSMLVRRFLRYGWKQEWFWHRSLARIDVISESAGVSHDTHTKTEMGPVLFGDGVLSLTNPNRPLGTSCTNNV